MRDRSLIEMIGATMLAYEQSRDIPAAYALIRGRTLRIRLGSENATTTEEAVMSKDQAKRRGKKAKVKGKEGRGVSRDGEGQKIHGIVENNLGDTAFPGPLQV
jgi:phage-related baseplate assembly protein